MNMAKKLLACAMGMNKRAELFRNRNSHERQSDKHKVAVERGRFQRGANEGANHTARSLLQNECAHDRIRTARHKNRIAKVEHAGDYDARRPYDRRDERQGKTTDVIAEAISVGIMRSSGLRRRVNSMAPPKPTTVAANDTAETSNKLASNWKPTNEYTTVHGSVILKSKQQKTRSWFPI